MDSVKTEEKGALGGLLSLAKRRKRESLPFEKSAPFILVAVLALMMADLTAVGIRSSMIPTTAPPAKREGAPVQMYKPRSDYDQILARNIFNSDGIIPETQGAGGNAVANLEGPAKESSLPLTLVGTIVHVDPGKSVATIQLKGSPDKDLPYIPNDDIEGMATLIKVERKKAFIRNLASGALEFIEIKDEHGLSFAKKPTGTAQDGPVEKEGDNIFAMSRADLETQMQNLPSLLTQARAVPNMVPGQPGRVDGFRILDIQPNSLFTKLGVQNGDVIKGVDGEPLDSPAKAMELYNSLRSKSQVRLQMERNGQTITMTYNIR